MAWNYKEKDLEDQLRDLKQQLSTKDQALATLNYQLLKQSEELVTTTSSRDEALFKLQHEADNVITLEEKLARQSEELQNERIHRANAEASQQNLHNELKQGDSSTKDLNSIISRLSHDLDNANAQLRKVTGEKSKLEVRVVEMDVLLQRQEMMPPPQPQPQKKAGGRPRASSLTHLNVASMEKDLEALRASSRSYQVDLENTKARMSKMQDDLVKVENEKLVLERRLAEKEAHLRSALEETEERQRELSFLHGQNGSAEREEQLLARLEEEEKKVELLTRELSAASRGRTGGLDRSLEKLQRQLDAESSKVRRLEEQEIQLTQEREEALNERDEAVSRAEELAKLIKEKEENIRELQDIVSGLRSELDSRGSPSPEANADSISKMLSAIERLRMERDNLQTSLDYLQAESQFTIQSLQNNLATKEQELCRASPEDRMDEDAPSAPNGDFEQVQKKLLEHKDRVSKLQDECHSLRSQLQGDAKAYTQTLTSTIKESAESLEAKIEELNALERRILEMTASLKDVTAERDTLADQSLKLQEEVNKLQQSLAEYERRVNALQMAQLSSLSHNSATQALKDQVTDLEARVLRRNEQIGVHQHDIKRLETNLRLAEDRLGEMASELEMANTEKMAMVEDCATARDEREGMRNARDAMEIDLDEMTKRVTEKSEENRALLETVNELRDISAREDASRTSEIASLVAIIAEHHCRLRSLVSKLRQLEQQQSVLAMEDSKSTLTESPICEQGPAEDVCMNNGVDDSIIQQLESDKARLSVSPVPTMEKISLVALLKAGELEVAEASRLAQLRDIQRSLDEKGDKTPSSTEQLKTERQSYLSVIRAFSTVYNRMVVELETRLQESVVRVENAKVERSLLETRIESRDQEVTSLQARLDDATREHQAAVEALVTEKNDLHERLAAFQSEIEGLKKTLEDEIDGRRSERESFDVELKASSEKYDHLVEAEAALQREVAQYRTELEEVHAKVEQMHADNAQIRSEMEELAGETLRANSKSQCLEQQLRSNEGAISNLKQQLTTARENLARSEKSGKAAEMNLQLAITQHDRTIVNLRQQLKDLDEDRSLILQLQQTVAELKEEIEEKDDLLRKKCDEIEANDDRAIAMLKESKKLQRTIESLTKKNATLQKKLDKASDSGASSSSTAAPYKSRAKSPLGPTPAAVPFPSKSTASAAPSLLAEPLLQRTFTPPAPTPPPKVVPEATVKTVFTPPQETQTPLHSHLRTAAESTSAGKKRRAPDDFDPSEPLPAQPIIVGPVTPRPRKPLRALKTGFTPVRGLGSSSRPTLGQPSPIRRNGSQATERIITDVTNATSKRAGATQGNGGWLGKLRGGPSKRLAQFEDSS